MATGESTRRERKRKWDQADPGSEALVQEAKRRAEEAAARLAKTLDVKKGNFEAELDINSQPPHKRYRLTSSSFHKEVHEKTGCAVNIRGRYLQTVGYSSEKPLTICIDGNKQEEVDQAVELIKSEMVLSEQTGDTTNGTKKEDEPKMNASGQYDEKVFLDMEDLPGFGLFGRILGSKGSYVKHITTQTGARVTIRGKGSTFTGPGSTEPLFLYIEAPSAEALTKAKDLAKNLVDTVRKTYDHFVAQRKARAEAAQAPPPSVPPPPPVPGAVPYAAYPQAAYPYGGYASYPVPPSMPPYMPGAVPAYPGAAAAPMPVPPYSTYPTPYTAAVGTTAAVPATYGATVAATSDASAYATAAAMASGVGTVSTSTPELTSSTVASAATAVTAAPVATSSEQASDSNPAPPGVSDPSEAAPGTS
eukprot:Rmarinus@m.8403